MEILPVGVFLERAEVIERGCSDKVDYKCFNEHFGYCAALALETIVYGGAFGGRHKLRGGA